MNILLLSQFFSSTRGGGEYLFHLIAKKLANNNHKVWVITNKIVGENYDTNKNITIIFVPPTLMYKGGLPPSFLDNLRYSFNAINVGKKIIKQEKIDIIHSNNFAPALAGSILSTLTSCHHTTTIHDVFSLCGKDYWKLWGKQSNVSKINVILAPFFEKLLLKLNYDCIHTVSETSKDDLIKFGSKKPIYVIYNSIEDVTNTYSSNVVPHQLIYVGRLVFYKNLEVVLRAISIVKKIEPAIKFVIVGSGPHKESLEKIISKLGIEFNVEIKGYVDANKKEELIESSSALAFPSLCEGFGIVILEAFAKRIPVLVSDIRPMSEIVENGKTGFVINPHDEKAWANSILSIIQNPIKTKTMGENGHQLLISKFNQDLLYQKIVNMYDDILQKNLKKIT
jgi:glycosyltransferase involved in cell wall biosynthesis